MLDYPLLSIVCVTYNHEPYIVQAIDSFLMQKTSFQIEIIIGEDCSNDGTREICIEYQKKYPNKIHLVISDRNVGAANNFLRSLKAARGKYIAYSDGDDYWTDPLKLQKQFNFLESEPEYAICFHNARLEYTQEKKSNTLYNINYQDTYSFKDLIFNNPIATTTCVFRNNLSNFKSGYENHFMLFDDNFHLLNAEFGLVKFLDEAMSVYRIHDGGCWSRLDLIKKATETLNYKYACYEYFKAHPQKKYFLQSVGNSYFRLSDAYSLNKSYFKFFKYNCLGLVFLYRGQHFSIKRLLKFIYAINPPFFKKTYSLFTSKSK